MNQQTLLTVCLILLMYKLGEFDEMSKHFDLIIFFTLVTCVFDQVVTLYGEIRCWSPLGLKGLIA